MAFPLGISPRLRMYKLVCIVYAFPCCVVMSADERTPHIADMRAQDSNARDLHGRCRRPQVPHESLKGLSFPPVLVHVYRALPNSSVS